MKIPLLFGGSTSTSKRKYLNFSEEVPLLPAECYITFGQMLYYFSTNIILLLVGSYITFYGGLTRPASANDFPLKGILLLTQSLIPSRPKRSLRGRHQIRL